MHERLPLLLRHAMYSLRGGFLVRPLSIALTLGCAGAVLSYMEEATPALSEWVPGVIFPSRADPQIAQIILGGIAASMMTVVSIVFAILLMTLTLASMQFSPRIIISFTRDRVTQWTLGIFLGTFLYCMAALPAARSVPRPFAPLATVKGAMLLAIACVGWLLFFIHHISQAIGVNQIVDRIASETEAVIDQTMPWPRIPDRPANTGDDLPGLSGEVVLSGSSGYIRFLDTGRLIELAKAYRVKIRVLRRVGQFIPAGVPLLVLSKIGKLTDEAIDDFRGTFDLGPSRTLQQDVEFGVLQIVDIALKAISPAMNDPTTAISCVDQLSRILIRFASREQPEPVLYDPPGVVRVGVEWLGFERLLDSAFEQIRMYSKADVAVSLRLLRALSDIAMGAPAMHRPALGEIGRRIISGCAEKLSEEEMRRLRVRLTSLEGVLAQGRPPQPG
jgi:uncharacterized membrane protein